MKEKAKKSPIPQLRFIFPSFLFLQVYLCLFLSSIYPKILAVYILEKSNNFIV